MKRKNNNIIGLFLAIAVLGMSTTGCKKYFEDYVVDPNNPSAVTPALLLASVEVATFAAYGGNMARQSGIFIQHVAGTEAGSQTVQLANYDITELTNVNDWRTLYAGSIMDANIIINEHGDGNPYYRGIARILLAMNVGMATDYWGDVPYRDASGGQTGNLNPGYDSQEQILTDIQLLCDQAIADLSMAPEANTAIPSSDDLIYGGDVAKWIAAAHVLKARYWNRLSQREPSSSANQVLQTLGAGGFTASSDDCNMIFGSGNSQNQWSAFEGSRGGYIRVSETFVDSLTNTADPRLAVLVGKDGNDSISGTPYDDVSVIESSYLSDYYASPGSPMPLISYVEQLFLLAEANLRAGNDGAAAQNHNEAVKASIMQITGAADPTYEGNFATEDAGSITLEKIMYQKWVALFVQCEAYADWRRTGFPMLSPNPNAPLGGIPVRYITSQEERLYNNNPSAIIVGDALTPVWWDN